MAAAPVLAVRDLSVALSRNGRSSRVLEAVSFAVAPHEIVALVGASGSGKSTLGLAIQGLLPRDARPEISGSICVAEAELVGAAEPALRQIRRSLVRVVPQDPLSGLDPTMTIGRQMAGKAREREAIAWLRRTGIADPERVARSYPHRLSGGQRQRVLIAMAMLARPRLLIADEPTTALDVLTQAQVLETLRGLTRAEGSALLFITHDLAVATSLADRVVVLEAGQVVEIGPVGAMLAAPQAAATRRLLAARYDLGSDRNRPLPAEGASVAWPAARRDASKVLELVGVSKTLGRRQVVHQVDLSIEAGESVAVVGESGAGKSTLLRIAAGLTKPDAGTVTRLGETRPQIVFQDPVAALTPWLSVGEQVADRLRGLGLNTAERRRRLGEAFAMVGLPESLMAALPGELSVGQCQRAVLARAIVVPPRLLLCDEPASAIDMPLAAAMLNLIGALRRRLGMALLFVTHDIAAARLIGDRIAVMQDGAVIEAGEAEALIARPATAHTRALVAAIPRFETAR
ncbi:hypothetical protein VW23_004440 [Devosia insulae DS-56]|uniref:ABC transporter domain-containing protein n=2 Tax=Devosia insulae TaxID=408174 RepID=A0A1E5XIW1_9HYPH|nr:hypothetical protein VW23_004440 [Devosia insulae DS-56]